MSKEVDPHPQGAGFLHQEAVPVLPHPQVELRLVPEASEELQKVDLGSSGFSAGDKVEEAHTFHIE
ncbi:hypothetical protein TthSNM11_06870 [Thermus thermophilus]|nr:hypothetical protein TthSNM11_06870 [Thermus thermophilus]